MRWWLYSGSLCLTVFLPFSLAAEEVYRWVDIHGNVYYADTQPLDTRSERVEIAPPPAEGTAMIQMAAPAADTRPEQALPLLSVTTASLGPCGRAREQLALLHAAVPVYLGNDGVWYATVPEDPRRDRSWLADASRPNAIRSARNEVLTRCSDPQDVARELAN